MQSPSAGDMVRWNRDHIASTHFTFEEHSHADPDCSGMCYWNEYALHHEQKYTKARHSAKKPTASEMRLWNQYCGLKNRYSKAEHAAQKPCRDEMSWWNNTAAGRAEPYSKEEYIANGKHPPRWYDILNWNETCRDWQAFSPDEMRDAGR